MKARHLIFLMALALFLTSTNQSQAMVSVKDFGAVGDGLVNDTRAIQMAINSVTSGSVHFPPGTYRTASPIHLRSNVNLTGDRATITYISPSSNNAAFFVTGPLPVASNIGISGFFFDGKGTWNSASFSNPYKAGKSVGFTNNQYGIHVSKGSSDIRIHNCEFSGLKTGIYTDGANNCRITDNQFQNMGMSAITVRLTNNTLITNNIIRGVLGNQTPAGETSIERSSYADGIYIHSSHDVIVYNNVIENCARIGIAVESDEKSPLCSRITISGNSIHNMNSCRGGEVNAAIWVESKRADGTVTIVGNNCDNTGAVQGSKPAVGINSCHSTTLGNTIRGFSGSGVIGREMNVVANKIESNGVGVEFTWHPLQTSLTRVVDNLISDNSASGILIENRGGIFVIQGNTIKDNGASATSTTQKSGIAILKYIPEQTSIIRNNIFITSADEGATKGQLYSIYGDTGWRADFKPHNVINNQFLFLGKYSRLHPQNLSVAPCSFAQSPYSNTDALSLSEFGKENEKGNINNKFNQPDARNLSSHTSSVTR